MSKDICIYSSFQQTISEVTEHSESNSHWTGKNFNNRQTAVLLKSSVVIRTEYLIHDCYGKPVKTTDL